MDSYEFLYELDKIFTFMYNIAPFFLWVGFIVVLLAIIKLIRKKKGIGLLIFGIIIFVIGFIMMEIVTEGL